MNRGFKYYFRYGVRTAAKLLLKGGKLLRYYICLFMGLIGRMIPFFGTVFPVADMRRAKIADHEGEFAIVRSFEGIERGGKFGTAVLAGAIKLLIWLGGLCVVGAIGAVLFFLGRALGFGVNMKQPIVMGCIFAVPAVAAAVVYSVFVGIMFAPLAYILDSNEKVGATRALTASMETMRRAGKTACFLNVFVPTLILSAYSVGAYYAGLGLATLFGFSASAAIIVLFAWLAVALIAFIVFSPVFIFGSILANAALFRDIALDPAALDNRTKGVFVKKCKTLDRVDTDGLDASLLDLFEHAPTYSGPAYANRFARTSDPQPKMTEYSETTAEEPTRPQESVDPPVSEQTETTTEQADTTVEPQVEIVTPIENE